MKNAGQNPVPASRFAANAWRMFHTAAIALLLLCAPCISPAVARQPNQQSPVVQAIVAISSNSIDLGDSIIYQITLDGVSTAEPPALPESDEYTASFIGGHDESSRSVMTINGKTTETSTLRYIMQWRITPSKAGVVTVPAFSFDVGGQSLKTQRARFTVTEGTDNPNFKLRLESTKTDGYVGEPIHLKLVWELRGNPRSAAFSGPDGGKEFDVQAIDPRDPQSRTRPNPRSDQYPVVPFLNGEAVLTRTQVTVDGQNIPAFVMDLVVTPRVAGKIQVGPFRVVIDEVVDQRPRSPFDSLFDNGDRTKRSVISSNTITLDVRPVPTEGKPADFAGLVGVYSIDAAADNAEANVGDPIPLTVTIKGPEPLDALKAPDLEAQSTFAAAFKPAPEGWDKSIAADSGSTPGQRTFTTTIRPKAASVTEIPAIRLPYFDTKTGKYAVATSKPIPLKVRASREITAADALRPGSSGSGFSLPAGSPASLTNALSGISANSESLGALSNQRVNLLGFAASPPGIVFFAAPPLALVGVILAVHRRRSQDPAIAARRAAVSRARGELNHASTLAGIHGAVRTALSPFLNVAPDAIVSSDAASTPALPPATASQASSLLGALEAASYNASSLQIDSIRTKARDLFNDLTKL